MTLADVKPAVRRRRSLRPLADAEAFAVSDAATDEKVLVPGSVGWTADEVMFGPWAGEFEARRYELIEGVIAKMPAAKFAGTGPVSRAVTILDATGEEVFGPGQYAYSELHLWITHDRTTVADAAFLDPTTMARHVKAARDLGIPDPLQAPCLVPPLILIESLSRGHERHDRVTKRRWYAQWGVPHYWLLDGRARRLDCLKLDAAKGEYVDDASGEGDAEVRPSLPFALTIPLSRLWPR